MEYRSYLNKRINSEVECAEGMKSLMYVVTSVMFFGSVLSKEPKNSNKELVNPNTLTGKEDKIIEGSAVEPEGKIEPLPEIPGTYPNYAEHIMNDYEIRFKGFLPQVDQKLNNPKLLHCSKELKELKNLIIKHESCVKELAAVLLNPKSSVESQTRAEMDCMLNELNIIRKAQDIDYIDTTVLHIKLMLFLKEDACKKARDSSKTPGTLKGDVEDIINEAYALSGTNSVIDVETVDTQEINNEVQEKLEESV